MKALVTGGGGFLGRHIVYKLLQTGTSVRVMGRREYPALKDMGVDCFTGDISDRDSVMQACKGMDLIYHVAAIPGIWGKWDTFYNTNYIGSKNVLEACEKLGIPRLIYTSSPSVIFDGSSMENVDETYPYPKEFDCYYPKTKAMAEKMILEANGKKGVYTTSIRPHLIWGPGDNHLIPRFLKKGKAGRIRQVGDGQNLVDTVYVENAAIAHLQVAEKLEKDSPVAGQAYFISQDEPIKLWEWINRFLLGANIPAIKGKISANTAYYAGMFLEGVYSILGLSGEPPMTRFLASELAKSHWYNISKAKKDFGYEVKVDTEEGYKLLFASPYFKELVANL
ncbi:NAD-dependent epimerase/dehydratase family protein [Candidatus Riflebacteria bacterium]